MKLYIKTYNLVVVNLSQVVKSDELRDEWPNTHTSIKTKLIIEKLLEQII